MAASKGFDRRTKSENLLAGLCVFSEVQSTVLYLSGITFNFLSVPSLRCVPLHVYVLSTKYLVVCAVAVCLLHAHLHGLLVQVPGLLIHTCAWAPNAACIEAQALVLKPRHLY